MTTQMSRFLRSARLQDRRPTLSPSRGGTPCSTAPIDVGARFWPELSEMLALLCPFPKLVARIPGLGPALFSLSPLCTTCRSLRPGTTVSVRLLILTLRFAGVSHRQPHLSTPLRAGPLRLRRAHLRHAFLELPRHMRHDTELPLDKHHLRPVMHLVFFSTQQPFEPRFSPFFRPPPLLSPPEIPVSAFPTTPRTARLRFSADSRFRPWTWA